MRSIAHWARPLRPVGCRILQGFSAFVCVCGDLFRSDDKTGLCHAVAVLDQTGCHAPRRCCHAQSSDRGGSGRPDLESFARPEFIPSASTMRADPTAHGCHDACP
eukprot:1040164-Prymnesium_polylepis.1